MAEEHSTNTNVETEVQDRGVFDFLKKNEEKKPEHETLADELEKAKISDGAEEKKEEEEEKKPSLLEKLHRSGSSSSSSSSEEEVEEGGEKIRRKKKKGLKEKIEEKFSGEKKDEEVHKIEPTEDTSIPIEKYEAVDVGVVTHDGEVKHPEEKKSFMEKIKEKLPGTHKKPEESAAPVAPAPVEAVTPPPAAPVEEAEAKEKKGILEKIKEKLPGYHKADEEKKETTSDQ